MIIDSHQHFWAYDPSRHQWIDESMQTIQKDFLPEDLKPILDDLAIDGCISVQVDQTEEETLYLLDLADKFDFIKGVVGWIDLRNDNLEDRLDFFSNYPKLAGFRHILQSEEPDRMLEADFLRGIEILGKHGYSYDVLIYPQHLKAATELVRRFPGQKFVIDHIAKPDMKNGQFEPWATEIARLAESEHVCCKLSGMITEADWKRWKPDDLAPFIDHVFAAFGPGRLMYGSDWPVCLLAGTYREVYGIVQDYLHPYSKAEKKRVLGGNALSFYGIDVSENKLQ